MNKIDHRRHYIIMLDTETANTIVREDGSLDMTSVFVYDIGWQVIDKQGRVYEKKSYVVREIFVGESESMKSAYYAPSIERKSQGVSASWLTTMRYAKTFSIRWSVMAL